MKIKILLLFFLVFSFNGFSATKTWHGPGAGTAAAPTPGAWNTAGNWTGGVPVANDDVIIQADVSGTGIITAVPTITLNSLTIGGTCKFYAVGDPSIMTITTTFSVAAGKTFQIGFDVVHLTFILNGTGTIDGTVLFTYYRGFPSYFTVNGTLTINGTLNYDVYDAVAPICTMIIPSGATLIMGPAGTIINSSVHSSPDPPPDFTLSSGATLKIASVNGITTAGATGNIQVAGTRTYSTGANYEYNNSVAPSVTGNGLSQNTPANVTINGAGQTVTQSATTSITGNLTVNATSTFAMGTAAIGFNIGASGNLTNNGTITAGTGTVTFNGTGAQTIGGSSITSFYNLTLNNTFVTTPQLALAINAGVQKTLVMTRGKINLAGFTLTLGTGIGAGLNGTLTFPAFSNAVQPISWMYGGTFTRWLPTAGAALAVHVNSGAGHFPMGSSTNYHPFWLSYSSGLTTGGTFSVTHNPSGGGSSAITNYVDASCGLTIKGVSTSAWALSTSATPVANTIGITYGGFGYATFLSPDVNASMALSTAGTCSGPSNINAGVYFEVERLSIPIASINGITWYVGTTDLVNSPLPIELTKFTATSCNKDVCLDWSTATETHNDYFTIEKTKDGSNYETVGTVDGAGTSTTNLNYSSIDNAPYEGVSYYRLKQTDFDGTFTYSNLEMVDFKSSGDFSFNVYPNPNDGTIINMSLSATNGEEVLVSVYDATGREVFSKVIVSGENSDNVYVLDSFGKLAPGVYMIKATSNQSIYNKKMIVK